MGFAFTLLYVALAYLSPVAVVPELAQYRVQLIVAVCAMLACIPDLPKAKIWRTPQLYLLIGLTFAVAVSNIVASHWFGGAISSLESFVPSAVPLVLVAVTCTTLKRLRVLCIVLGCIALYYIAVGAAAYGSQDFQSLYILVQNSELPRIRGLASVNDPNDLAQFIVVLVPLSWLLWRHGIAGKISALLYTIVSCVGIFLTHSRGATIALAVIVLFHFKDRIGTVGAAVTAGCLFVATKLLQFSGGRDISAESGADRMAAWGVGLEFFKSSPLFGIGYNRFAENYEITAHNSFVLGLAELGLFGYFFWIALLVFTFMRLNRVIHPGPAAQLSEAGDENAPEAQVDGNVIRWARAIRVSLAGFLTAAFFLSRTYIITLYLLLGMAIAVVRLSRKEEGARSESGLLSMMKRSFAFEIGSVLAIYALLRLRWLL